MAQPPESASSYEALGHWLRTRFGFELRPASQARLAHKLERVLAGTGCRTAADLVTGLSGSQAARIELELAGAVTTNYTAFLREPHHFHLLAGHLRALSGSRRRVLLWSAAASSGEEPYSMAMAALETLGPQASDTVAILATDLSPKALARAVGGLYPRSAIEDLPPVWRARYFRPAGSPGTYAVSPEVRRMVRFRRLNLAAPLPALPLFHCIFCCNVMIYFDAAARQASLARLAAQLAPGGLFMAGLAEGAMPVPAGLRPLAQGIWVAPALPAPAKENLKGKDIEQAYGGTYFSAAHRGRRG